MQIFENMSDIEAVYDAFSVSKLYQEMLASDEMELTGRALLKMHHRQRTSDEGKYMVLTKFEAETTMLDEAKAVMGLFMDNGSVGCAYGTFMAGSFVGQHLIGARYPSMQAIQRVYDFVSELLESRTVSQSTYDQAEATLGRLGVVDLVGIVGYYCLVSITLNVFDMPLPNGEAPPLSP